MYHHLLHHRPLFVSGNIIYQMGSRSGRISSQPRRVTILRCGLLPNYFRDLLLLLLQLLARCVYIERQKQSHGTCTLPRSVSDRRRTAAVHRGGGTPAPTSSAAVPGPQVANRSRRSADINRQAIVDEPKKATPCVESPRAIDHQASPTANTSA